LNEYSKNLIEILEEEKNLQESIIQLRVALKYSTTEEEKENINKKIDLMTSKIYDSNENQIFTNKNFSNSLSEISSYMNIDFRKFLLFSI